MYVSGVDGLDSYQHRHMYMYPISPPHRSLRRVVSAVGKGRMEIGQMKVVKKGRYRK